jgi:glycerol uptake facilitator protein
MRAARSIAWITAVLLRLVLGLDKLDRRGVEHGTKPAIFANTLDLRPVSDDYSTLSNVLRITRKVNGMDENTRWQKLAAEFLGTAFLVFVGVGSVPALLLVNQANGSTFSGSDLGIISLAFASIVIVTVYVFGYIGGNHINPAVTFGLAATGKFPWSEVPAYVAAQVAGAVVGAFTIVGVLGKAASDIGLGVASYSDAIPWYQAFFAEFIGTFLLVFAVFGVIYRKAAPGWAGLAIGMVVFAAIIPVAPTTGASINPARTTGPMLVQQIMGGEVSWEQWPVYVIGELLAGVAAAVAFGFIAHTPHDNAHNDLAPAPGPPAAVPSEV